MGRSIGAAVAGYVVMFFATFVLLTLGWMLLGTAGTFQPGSWDVTGTWVVITLAVALVAGVLGGLACAAIAYEPRGLQVLVGLAVVLGLLMSLPVLTLSAERIAEVGARPDQVDLIAAMSMARPPKWVALAWPFVGALGVWLGGKVRPAAPTAPALKPVAER